MDNILKEKFTTPVQQFIIIVGTEIVKPLEFYVFIDGAKFKFFSFLSTTDNCFKLFQVLNLKYPLESISVFTVFANIIIQN